MENYSQQERALSGPLRVVATLGAFAMSSIMVISAIHIRNKIEAETPSASSPPPEASVPPARTSLAATTSTEATVTTSTTFPTAENKPPVLKTLESGLYTFIGGGALLNATTARGVDCDKSYEPDKNDKPLFNEISLPAPLSRTTTTNKHGAPSDPVIYMGEEAGERKVNLYQLSNGWALEHSRQSGEYTLYEFSTVPQSTFKVDIQGVPIKKLSEKDLRSGETVNDDKKTLQIKINPKTSAGAGDSLVLTLRCNQ